MVVSELIAALSALPDDMEVRVETTFAHNEPMRIQSVLLIKNQFVLRDHVLMSCASRTFTSYDGTEYEIGWL